MVLITVSMCSAFCFMLHEDKEYTCIGAITKEFLSEPFSLLVLDCVAISICASLSWVLLSRESINVQQRGAVMETHGFIDGLSVNVHFYGFLVVGLPIWVQSTD